MCSRSVSPHAQPFLNVDALILTCPPDFSSNPEGPEGKGELAGISAACIIDSFVEEKTKLFSASASTYFFLIKVAKSLIVLTFQWQSSAPSTDVRSLHISLAKV